MVVPLFALIVFFLIRALFFARAVWRTKAVSFSLLNFFEFILFASAVIALVGVIISFDGLRKYTDRLNSNTDWQILWNDNHVLVEFEGEVLTGEHVRQLRFKNTALPIRKFTCKKKIENGSLSSLPREPKYELIDLSESTISDSDLEDLSFVEVESLDFSGTQVTGSNLYLFDNCQELQSVSLAGCSIANDELLNSLRRLNLNYIDLSFTNIDNRTIEKILDETTISSLGCLGAPSERRKVRVPKGKYLEYEWHDVSRNE